MVEGTDWAVARVVRVVDGDTVRLIRKRTTHLDGLTLDVYDSGDDGVSVRLVNLDTPERGQDGYTEAADDLRHWIGRWRSGLPAKFRVITYPGGGFDRLLGDIYVEGDIGNTATQWMLRDKGWKPYVKGQ